MSGVNQADEQSEARERFLRLRDAVGLPRGGEVTHKHESVQIANHLGIDAEGWSAPRINFECIKAAQEYRYGFERRGWDEAKEGARDYGYIQSSEAKMIAAYAEDINRFEWCDGET